MEKGNAAVRSFLFCMVANLCKKLIGILIPVYLIHLHFKLSVCTFAFHLTIS